MWENCWVAHCWSEWYICLPLCIKSVRNKISLHCRCTKQLEQEKSEGNKKRSMRVRDSCVINHIGGRWRWRSKSKAREACIQRNHEGGTRMVSMDGCYHFSAVYGRGVSGGTGYRSSCNHVDSSLQSNRTVVKSAIFMSKPKYRTILTQSPLLPRISVVVLAHT